MPIPVTKILIVNSLLFLYYFTPNLSSFLGISFLLLAVFTDKPYDQLAKLADCSIFSQEKFSNKVNSLFSAYLNMSYSESKLWRNLEALWIGIAYLLLCISWLLPSWLLLFVLCQTYATWELLEQFKIIEKAEQKLSIARSALQKFINHIPRHSSVAN